MSCFLFSLRFTAPVHFGLSDAAMSLYASEETFRADTLFSALCHTALHAEGEAGVTRLCEAVRRGELTLSDAMPYCGDTFYLATVYKGNIIKNLIMDCQSYTKYRPNETTGGIFVSWRRKEELPTGA